MTEGETRMARHRYLCECETPGCTARISLARADWLFDSRLGRLVVPDHAHGALVRRAPGYVVVASHVSVLNLTERRP